MIRLTRKQIVKMVETGVASPTMCSNDIPEDYATIAQSYGIYGITAKLFQGCQTRTLYAHIGNDTGLYTYY